MTTAWGAPLINDDGLAVKESDKPKDVNPNLIVDQTMGATTDEVRDYDHTGQMMAQPNNAPLSEQVIQKDQGVTRSTYADQPDAPLPPESAASAPDFENQDNVNIIETNYKGYKYSMKETVLCTKNDPPGPETQWKMGRICELMLEGYIRVKCRDGTKVVCHPHSSNIRPMTEAEITQYKATHKGEQKVPIWVYVACFPCVIVAAPFYYLGCCEGAGITTLCDSCADSCDCCCDLIESCGDVCEACLEVVTCGLC